MAAKRRGRRWNPNNFISRVRDSAQLSTLAGNTPIVFAVVTTGDTAYRAISLKATYTLSDFTAGEGPIHVGLAHGDYTATEVDEWFESQSLMTRGDKIVQEQSNRLCRMVGTFSGLGDAETLNDGKPIRTKLNWQMSIGSAINVWIYNAGSGTLTTGAEVDTVGQIFGRWNSA